MADDDLVRVLSEIQRRGGIGRTPLVDAVAHSDRFVAAVPADASTLVDLGSGGGLPALVIAARRPDVQVVMVERRAKRADLLRYGVQALGMAQHVTVFEGDVADFAAGSRGRCDVVTARSFGPRSAVLGAARPMLRPLGLVLISAGPDEGIAGFDHPGFEHVGSSDGIHRFRLFHVEHPLES